MMIGLCASAAAGAKQTAPAIAASINLRINSPPNKRGNRFFWFSGVQ
jgi:hypothetical protein